MPRHCTPPARAMAWRWGCHGAGPSSQPLSLSSWSGSRLGYPLQRHYLENRYADPQFTTPGLNAAFKWSSSISGARIATTSTRQYPLYGTDLSNHVQFVGQPTPHGGFDSPHDLPHLAPTPKRRPLRLRSHHP